MPIALEAWVVLALYLLRFVTAQIIDLLINQEFINPKWWVRTILIHHQDLVGQLTSSVKIVFCFLALIFGAPRNASEMSSIFYVKEFF